MKQTPRNPHIVAWLANPTVPYPLRTSAEVAEGVLFRHAGLAARNGYRLALTTNLDGARFLVAAPIPED